MSHGVETTNGEALIRATCSCATWPCHADLSGIWFTTAIATTRCHEGGGAENGRYANREWVVHGKADGRRHVPYGGPDDLLRQARGFHGAGK